jgi:hypothetical protein
MIRFSPKKAKISPYSFTAFLEAFAKIDEKQKYKYMSSQMSLQISECDVLEVPVMAYASMNTFSPLFSFASVPELLVFGLISDQQLFIDSPMVFCGTFLTLICR